MASEAVYRSVQLERKSTAHTPKNEERQRRRGCPKSGVRLGDKINSPIRSSGRAMMARRARTEAEENAICQMSCSQRCGRGFEIEIFVRG